jgi:hypothetical protein
MDVTVDVHNIDFDTFSPINLADTLTIKHSESLEFVELDLGHDGNLSISARFDDDWERHLRADNFSYSIS